MVCTTVWAYMLELQTEKMIYSKKQQYIFRCTVLVFVV